MNNLWSYIQGLSLTASNQRWLANHLIESAKRIDARENQELVFPKVSRDFKPSSKLLSMTCGQMPKSFDVDKELEKMWEERAL